MMQASDSKYAGSAIVSIFTPVCSLEMDPRLPVDAIRHLWIITNEAAQKTEAARLAEQSNTLGVYAHLVICFQRFRSLLSMVEERRGGDGRLAAVQTAEQIARAGDALRDSASEHFALACSVVEHSPRDVQDAFLVRHEPVTEVLMKLGASA